ncbi:hypothetical protein [Paludibaculum fermentans]|uniref:Uncharacterized protein n=1 Tax=Paludibaculum fermentans TaxID=1473598 RepID=A0A7S7SKM0_PALFE|nr:hypothetical protein [Paludibaculum fermentans]QOY87576.1 hypothetical protein IRI77_33285 [Paludibaculum fermentans]
MLRVPTLTAPADQRNEATSSAHRTGVLFFDEGDGRTLPGSKSPQHRHRFQPPGNQDPAAGLQPIRVPRNEASPADEDGLPNLLFNVSRC